MNTNILILLALLSEASATPEPWSLSNIKTNRPLGPGEAWCTHSHENFTEADLPAGYRPLLKDELVIEGDEVKLTYSGWVRSNNPANRAVVSNRLIICIAQRDLYQQSLNLIHIKSFTMLRLQGK